MQPSEIQQLIQNGLPAGAVVEVSSLDNTHFEAIVSSSAFAGKSRVQQQQLVYSSLNPLLKNGTIHALSLKTYLPEHYPGRDS